MAITQNPLIGRTSGKLANVVFQRSYQQNIIRSKALQQKDPKTPEQLLCREKFNLVLSAVRMLLPFFRIGYKGYTDVKSAYSWGIGSNLPAGLVETGGIWTLNPATFQLGNGSLEDFAWRTFTHPDPNRVRCRWYDTIVGNGSLTDRVSFVVFGTDNLIKAYSLNVASRGDLLYDFVLDEGVFSIGDIFLCLINSIETVPTYELSRPVFRRTINV